MYSPSVLIISKRKELAVRYKKILKLLMADVTLVNNLSDIDLFENGKRNWAKTNGKEFSVCRLVHLNTIANFKNFRGKIRKWKKNNK